MHWHVTMAGDERVALFPSEAHRLGAARTIARVGGAAQCLFCAVDDHVHVVVEGERRRAAQLAGNLSQALGRVAAAPLEPARVRPVDSRGHLESLVRYVLDQSGRHEVATATHPALWAGSCFPDLVGARILPGFTPRALREALPRLGREAVWRAVGLEPVEPASDEILAGLGVDALLVAARAAVGRPGLGGLTPEIVAARRVVASLGRRLVMPAPRVADALGVTARSLRREAKSPVQPALERAVRLTVALHAACR